jgi:hypothetical protein
MRSSLHLTVAAPILAVVWACGGSTTTSGNGNGGNTDYSEASTLQPTSSMCGNEVCSGCCDTSQTCQPGTIDTACGTGGGACEDCEQSGATCGSGACSGGSAASSSSSSGGATRTFPGLDASIFAGFDAAAILGRFDAAARQPPERDAAPFVYDAAAFQRDAAPPQRDAAPFVYDASGTGD